MSYIAPLQEKILDILKQARQDELDGPDPDPITPKVIDPYGGELNPDNRVRNLPAVFVDVPSAFEITAEGVQGTIFNGDYTPELILFAQNLASGSAQSSDLAKLADWTINALKGKTITVNGLPLEIARTIRGRLITDMEPASAILSIPMSTNE